MGKLANHFYRLQIGNKLYSSAVENPLHIEFSVRKTLKKDPNTLSLRVFNLAEDTYKAFASGTNPIIQLEAGYEDEHGVIFLGDVRDIWTGRTPPHTITYFESGDGEKPTRFDRINKAFRKGTPLKNIIIETSKAMGLESGNLEKAVQTAKSVGGATTTLNGTVISGNASNELTKLMRSAGFEWSIQDRAFQVLEAGKTLDTKAVLLNKDTGLIGSPEPSADDTIRFECALRPSILPGRQVKIESSQISDYFRVETIDITGVFGVSWSISAEAKKI